MAETTIWWLLAGTAVAVELLTGTFYLLMLAIGLVAAALAAHAGLSSAGTCCAGAGRPIFRQPPTATSTSISAKRCR
jgi:membrane protein implicated in regulation of membrane protease activity